MHRTMRNQIVRNKDSDYVALLMDPGADYATVVSKAAAAFRLNPPSCSVFHLSGCKVRDDQIVENGCSYRWSIRRYIPEVSIRPILCY